MIFVDDCLNRAFYKEKALVGASSVNVKFREDSFPALVMNHFVFIYSQQKYSDCGEGERGRFVQSEKMMPRYVL